MRSILNTIAGLALVLLATAPGRAADDSVDRLTRMGIDRETARQVVARWHERHPEREPDAILSLIEQAANVGAPADLVAAKAMEGLAKGVPETRLLPSLSQWGRQLADAARTARVLRQELRSEGIPEREAILRLSVLQRARHDDAWLTRLRDEAKASETDLGGFLRVGEAVSHLTSKLGLDQADAENLGKLFIRRQLAQEDIGKFIRAIEFSKERWTTAEAAQSISEKILRGMSPDEVLRAAGIGRPGHNGQDREAFGATGRQNEGNKSEERDSGSGEGKSGSDGN